MLKKADVRLRIAIVAFFVGAVVGSGCAASFMQGRMQECAIQLEASRLANNPDMPMNYYCGSLRARAFAPALERVTGIDVTEPYR